MVPTYRMRAGTESLFASCKGAVLFVDIIFNTCDASRTRAPDVELPRSGMGRLLAEPMPIEQFEKEKPAVTWSRP